MVVNESGPVDDEGDVIVAIGEELRVRSIRTADAPRQQLHCGARNHCGLEWHKPVELGAENHVR
jgi:hypothetical protein